MTSIYQSKVCGLQHQSQLGLLGTSTGLLTTGHMQQEASCYCFVRGGGWLCPYVMQLQHPLFCWSDATTALDTVQDLQRVL